MDVIALDTCFPFSVFIQQFTFSFSKQMDVGHSKWKIMLRNTNIIIFHVCAVEWYTPENGIQSNKKKENKRVEWEFLRKSKLYLSSFSFSTVVFLFCFFFCLFVFCLGNTSFIQPYLQTNYIMQSHAPYYKSPSKDRNDQKIRGSYLSFRFSYPILHDFFLSLSFFKVAFWTQEFEKKITPSYK